MAVADDAAPLGRGLRPGGQFRHPPPAEPMNPLLFADWGRMNRLFTRIMWVAAAIMICVVGIAIAMP